MPIPNAAVAVAVVLVIGLVQDSAASDTARVIMDKARAECHAVDGGVLETDPQRTVSLADLTGDGRPEEIVDANQFYCPTARTLFCGTGGCQLTVIVEEQPFDFLAKAWKVAKASNGRATLKLAVHWSQCDYKRTCWETFAWTGSVFKSLGSNPE